MPLSKGQGPEETPDDQVGQFPMPPGRGGVTAMVTAYGAGREDAYAEGFRAGLEAAAKVVDRDAEISDRDQLAERAYWARSIAAAIRALEPK